MNPSEEQPSGEVWTPLKVLNWAVPFLKGKGLGSPRLDAECLMAHVLGCDRLRVYLQFDRPLSGEERARLRDLVARRARHEPLAYLLGEREFYGIPFGVNPSVLIPRPETEALVEEGLRVLGSFPEERRLALDLGTGSGCLAVALAVKDPAVRVWAVDSSEGALQTALQNARRHGVQDRVTFRLGHWWEALEPGDPPQYSVILSNPPYISLSEKAEIAQEILAYEPNQALFPGTTGLESYEAIGVGLEKRLTPGGCAFLELNSNLADKIEGIWSHWDGRKILRDLQGLPRVLSLPGPPIA